MSEIPGNSGKPVKVGENKIALFRDGNEVFALQDRCPHQGAPLYNGLVKNGVLRCMFHGWMFEIKNGAYTFNPDQHLKTYPTKTEGTDVYVGIEES